MSQGGYHGITRRQELFGSDCVFGGACSLVFGAKLRNAEVRLPNFLWQSTVTVRINIIVTNSAYPPESIQVAVSISELL